MDTLVELPIEQWPVFMDKLRSYWPMNVAGYYAVKMNKTFPEIRKAFKCRIFCPYGDMNNGFVGVSDRADSYPEVIMFSIDEDTSKIEAALIDTKLIDWTKRRCINLISSTTLRSWKKILEKIPVNDFYTGLLETYYLDKTVTKFNNLRCPENTYVSSIRGKDIKIVDDSWPYQYKNSDVYFKILVQNGLSFGLYSTENNEILAWVFINEYQFIQHLFCVEEYRRRGYAEFLVKHVINKQLDEANDLYAYVVIGNYKSSGFFKKLGFSFVDVSGFIELHK